MENLTPQQIIARQELWRRGDLRFKLHPTQKKIYALLEGRRRFFLRCSRRLGKSFALCVICLEHAIKKPGARISYAAPGQKDAVQIVSDLMAQILADCPEDIRPEFHAADKEYRFPHNGAVIRFSGVNNEHHENLRGRAADVFVLDEVGQMDDLDYILNSIVSPMTATTKGRVLMASTPPRSPGHDMYKIVQGMEKRGEVATFTLLDAPHIDAEEKAEMLERAGEDPINIPAILAGKLEPQGTTALREYFCQFVTDSASAVLPEFTAQAQAEICIPWERPPYFDSYVSIDPGFSDKTGIIFGYWDFVRKKLVIQDEVMLTRATTDDIAESIKHKEEELWNGKRPLARISDIDLRLIADLQQRHGIFFTKANRQDSLGAIDLVRSMIRRREIIIDPKCVALRRQMANAVWNRKATDFERSAEDSHQDALAALKYLCRAVVRDRNPYPSWYGSPGFHTHSPNSNKKPHSVFSDTPLGRKFAKKWS